MHDNTLLVVFIGILAFAVLMQSVLFFLMYLSIRRLTGQIRKLSKDLRERIGNMTVKVESTLSAITEVTETIKPVAKKLSESTDMIHARIVDINGFVKEMTSGARREMAGIQETLHGIQGVFGVLSENLLVPLNKVNALTKAVRVAFEVFFRRRKKQITEASRDDDIFF